MSVCRPFFCSVVRARAHGTAWPASDRNRHRRAKADQVDPVGFAGRRRTQLETWSGDRLRDGRDGRPRLDRILRSSAAHFRLGPGQPELAA